MPSTKPDLSFDENGVCSACRSFQSRKEISWEARALEFLEVVQKYQAGTKSEYDCIIPISGGKDSTVQVLKVLEMGLRPLGVNSTTCDLSDLGRRNLENIKNLGVDVLEFAPNKVLRRKLNKIALETVGDIAWPEHVGIFTIPVKIAVKFNIPLIIWGENSQNEYGGPAAAAENNVLDRSWLEEFGGLLGMRVTDFIGMDGITENDISAYLYPSDEELRNVGVTGLFLGYYFPWDSLSNAILAKAFGFESYPKHVEGSLFDFENLDNYQHGIHDYFKFLKYGYGRTTDHVCMQIRRGRMTRKQGLQVVRSLEGKFPSTYLGKSIIEILKPLSISINEFNQICDRFTNPAIFAKDGKGNFLKDSNGNLMKIEYDN